MSSIASFHRFSPKWLIPAIILTVIYWLWFGSVVGVDQTVIVFYIFVIFLFFTTRTTRNLGIGFSPLFVYLVLYESLRVLHRSNSLAVHIEDLYLFELKYFGINVDGVRMTLCEYFNLHQNTFFDLFAGISYITWVPFPVIFGFILYFSKKNQILFNFWMTFLLANLFGFTGYILYPAAAPWYFFEFGNELVNNASSSAAGLLRFDEIINFPIYANMYSQGTNTFGAMPSMHAAFPLILVYFSTKFGNKLLTGIFTVSLIGIWFGAVYSNHHYLIDVIAGIGCGILAIFITESIVNRKFAITWYKNIIDYIS